MMAPRPTPRFGSLRECIRTETIEIPILAAAEMQPEIDRGMINKLILSSTLVSDSHIIFLLASLIHLTRGSCAEQAIPMQLNYTT